MRFFTCPCCDGTGGETEAILDDGSGPYYPCCFCDEEGKVGIVRRLIWLWDCQIMEWWRYKQWRKNVR